MHITLNRHNRVPISKSGLRGLKFQLNYFGWHTVIGAFRLPVTLAAKLDSLLTLEEFHSFNGTGSLKALFAVFRTLVNNLCEKVLPKILVKSF